MNVEIQEGTYYAVISAQTGYLNDFTKQVDRMLKSGWTLVGGIAVARSQGSPLWAQALTRGDEA